MSNACQASHKTSGALSKLIASGQQYAGMPLNNKQAQRVNDNSKAQLTMLFITRRTEVVDIFQRVTVGRAVFFQVFQGFFLHISTNG